MKKKQIRFRLLACIILAGMFSLGQSGQVYAQCSTPSPITGSVVLCTATSTTTLYDVTTGGTWSTSDGSNVSVNATTGVVTGISGGIGIVSYTVPGGCYVIAHIFDGAITGLPTICSGGSSVTMGDVLGGGTWSTTSSDISITSGTGIVSVAGGFTGPTTTAAITYTPLLSTGCSAVSTTISVDLTPTVASLVSSPSGASICEWAPINFTTTITGGLPPYTYNWWWIGGSSGTFASNSGVTGLTSTGYQLGGITLAEGGTYYGDVIDNLGCSTGNYTGPTISVTPGPNIYPISYVSSDHTPGAYLQISNSDYGINYDYGIIGVMAVGYFSGIGGAVTFRTDLTASGNYYVTASDPGTGCSALMGPALIPICPTCRIANSQLSVLATSTVEPLTLFPNPNNGNFTLSGSGDFILDAQVVKAEIIDITGHMVLALDVAVANGSISQSIQLPRDIANGTYFVKLSTGMRSEVLRFSLNR